MCGRVAVVSDEPDKYGSDNQLPGRHAASITATSSMTVQRELREIPGVTVLIFDQTCAAEKRRRRKRKLMVDPPKRAFINERVCEGCGDCGTGFELRRRRAGRRPPSGASAQIDQSSCNKDFSCVEGLLPQFRDRAWRPAPQAETDPKALDAAAFPEPTQPSLDAAL